MVRVPARAVMVANSGGAHFSRYYRELLPQVQLRSRRRGAGDGLRKTQPRISLKPSQTGKMDSAESAITWLSAAPARESFSIEAATPSHPKYRLKKCCFRVRQSHWPRIYRRSSADRTKARCPASRRRTMSRALLCAARHWKRCAKFGGEQRNIAGAPAPPSRCRSR